MAKWLKDQKEYALKECLAGKEVPGWKAVEGRGSREWTDMDKAFKTLTDNGYRCSHPVGKDAIDTGTGGKNSR